MRTATYPKKGYAFQSKENSDECPLMVYLAEGRNIEDHYNEITEEEYNSIQAEVEAEMLRNMPPLYDERGMPENEPAGVIE